MNDDNSDPKYIAFRAIVAYMHRVFHYPERQGIDEDEDDYEDLYMLGLISYWAKLVMNNDYYNNVFYFTDNNLTERDRTRIAIGEMWRSKEWEKIPAVLEKWEMLQ